MSKSIKSRKHALAPLVALTAAGFGLPAIAQTAAPAKEEQALPKVTVSAHREAPNKADVSANSKITQPLLETPKTIQVVKKETLQEQAAGSLAEALQNTPGITLQMGENGNTAAGDTFQMRGFAAQTSTFVDGIRDLGAVTRDVFNLEQIEIVKGPAGSDTGRGASAGYINLISKLPSLDDAHEGTLTLGDASRKRATLDSNLRLGESTAARLNLMAQDNGVPGRDLVKKKGWAIAPSIAFGLGSPTRFYLFSQHVRQNNVPDGGLPTIGWEGFYNATEQIRNAPKIDTSNFYGSAADREKVDADMVSAKLEMDLGGGTTIRNLSRYGRTHMDRVLTGALNIAAPNPADLSTWTITRSRQRVDQTNEVLANQTSLNTRLQTGGIQHDLSAGLELIYESQLTRGTGTTTQTIRGVNYTAIAVPVANLYNPNVADVMGTPYLTGVDTEGKTTTKAIYVNDTLTVNDALKVSAGLRTEHYSLSTNSGTIVTAANLAQFPGYAVGGVAPNALRDSDWITSWNLGAVYKLAPNGTLYAGLGNSLTPPGSANFTLSASGQASGTAEPQETTNYEFGTKWDLLDRRLALTAAVYRTENDKQVTQDPLTQASLQAGKTRVEGIELAAVGQITNFWQISAGLQTMKTQQLNQQSVNATSGAVTVTDGVRWSPEFSATLWTSYQLGEFTIGGGVRHTGEQKRVVTVSNLATQNTPNLPAFTVVDLMGAWRVNKSLNLQLNVSNVTDEVYMAALNNGGSRMVLGAPRAVTLSARFLF